MSSPTIRRDMDLMKLMMTDYKVEMINDGMQVFFVEFHGPKDSLYQGGVWKIRVELPDAYPYKSPSTGFVNKITILMLMKCLARVALMLSTRHGVRCLVLIKEVYGR